MSRLISYILEKNLVLYQFLPPRKKAGIGRNGKSVAPLVSSQLSAFLGAHARIFVHVHEYAITSAMHESAFVSLRAQLCAREYSRVCGHESGFASLCARVCTQECACMSMRSECVRTRVCMPNSAYTSVHACLCVHECACLPVRTRVCMPACACMSERVCMSKCASIHQRVWLRAHVRKFVFAREYAYGGCLHA